MEDAREGWVCKGVWAEGWGVCVEQGQVGVLLMRQMGKQRRTMGGVWPDPCIVFGVGLTGGLLIHPVFAACG